MISVGQEKDSQIQKGKRDGKESVTLPGIKEKKI